MPTPPDSISTVRRWWLLTVGLVATLCATVFINGIAFLIPALDATGYPLAFALCGVVALAALPVVPVRARPGARTVGT